MNPPIEQIKPAEHKSVPKVACYTGEIVQAKLKTLDDLYQLLKHDQNILLMVGLEITIALLFVIDLVIRVMRLKGN